MKSALALPPEVRAPLSVVVSRRLREMIVSGRVKDGTALPSEKELTEQLGVGRSTVREALRILQAQGLLSGGDSVSTHKARVSSEQSMATAAEVMENVLRLGRVSLEDLVALRVVIEGAVAVEAASALSPPEGAIEAARAAVLAMQDPKIKIADFRSADLAFHQALARATGNAAYALVMAVLRETIASHLGETLRHQADTRAAMSRLAAEHAAILDAVTRKKPKRAKALLTAHIRDFYAARGRKGRA